MTAPQQPGYDWAAFYASAPTLPRLAEVNQMSLPDAFLWYNRNRYNVHPGVIRDGERMLARDGGYSFATLPPPTPEEAAWLAANWKPEWFLAMIMGEDSSGLFTLDVDDTAQWAGLMAELGDALTPTATERTGSGKLHLVYRRPDPADVPAQALRKGSWSADYPRIEVLSKGMVVVPPSRHHRTGQPGQWLEQAPQRPREPGGALLERRAVTELDEMIARKTAEIAIHREATRRVDAQGWQPGTAEQYPGTLADSLARERPAQRYLVEGLWGVAHNLSIEAMFKTGKTTLAGSLAGSLADGTDFLGFRTVHPPAGRIGIWNLEMDPDDFDDYLAPHVADRTRIAVAHLRGHPMPLASSAPARHEAVSWLRDQGVSTWITDSWTRLCAWCGIDPIDNFAVGKLTAVLDEIKAEAGVTALAVTSHMPHQAKTDRAFERALGAQAFSGWVDVMWRYVRDEAGNRYLAAEGRKARLEECQVFLDGSGRLRAFAGDRDSTAEGMTEYALLAKIQQEPGLSTEQLRKSVSKRKGDVSAILRILAEYGRIFCQNGPRNSVLWYPVV